jgi:uncharacterized MAPEG superfamily protein
MWAFDLIEVNGQDMRHDRLEKRKYFFEHQVAYPSMRLSKEARRSFLSAAAILTAHVAATHSWMTEWGAQLYFWARVVYLALYAAGIFLLRSLVWNVATLGIVLILLSLV